MTPKAYAAAHLALDIMGAVIDNHASPDGTYTREEAQVEIREQAKILLRLLDDPDNPTTK